MPTPLLTTVVETRAALLPFRRAGKRIGMVPTMGALHEGHLSLVRASKAECDVTVVWIYVNPSQFGPHEDLAKYPRTLTADLDKLVSCDASPLSLRERARVRAVEANEGDSPSPPAPLRAPRAAWSGEGSLVVLAPSDAEVYHEGHATWVEVGSVAEPLEGQFRPGHFRGVATIVLKMFNMVRPDIAYFGQKDYQQAAVIRRMAADLDVPVGIRVCPIVREADGLAMSSRNVYLSSDARQRATVLWRSLKLAQRVVAQGQRDAACIQRQMTEMIVAAGGAIDYVAIVDPESLVPVARISGSVVALLAVKIDGTRLIDNMLLTSDF